MPLSRLKELNTKDCLWIYVLRILRDRETHAYTLRQEVARRFGFTPGAMTAYKVLYLLQKSGHVRKKAEGRKQVYSITPKGRQELAKAVEFYREIASSLE